MSYPFVPAKWYHQGGNTPVKRVVIHRMESPEKGSTAEDVARYFQRLPSDKKASAHYCIDNDSIVRCVKDRDIAYHAPPNTGSIGLEHAGYTKDDDWTNAYCDSMLHLSAGLAAEIVRDHDIPLKWLSVQDLIDGLHGFTSHKNVSLAFHMTNHTDPGDSFPVDRYFAMARLHLDPTHLPTHQEVHVALAKPACAIKGTQTGRGYWIFAEDGGVFSFGDAVFHGSAVPASPSKIVDAELYPSDAGYWLLNEDGAVYALPDTDSRYYGGAN